MLNLPNQVQPCFDDPTLKQQSLLQQQLKQSAPQTTDGGREVLWWCWSCSTAWHQYARCRDGAAMRLKEAQAHRVAHALHADLGSLPQALCPACTADRLGGIPSIEEFPFRLGYRMGWERATSPAFFLCLVYATHPGLDAMDVVQEALTCASDLPGSSIQVREVMIWLSTLSEPEWVQFSSLSDEHTRRLSQNCLPPPGLSWGGYAWPGHCPPLGEVVVVTALTLSPHEVCSPALLLACWRHIACEIALLI